MIELKCIKDYEQMIGLMIYLSTLGVITLMEYQYLKRHLF